MKLVGARLEGFWRWAALVVVVNFLIIGVVLLRGDQRQGGPTSVIPAAGAIGISTRPIIRLTFQSPPELASAKQFVSLDPPSPVSVDVTGNTLTLNPLGALLPNTAYALVLHPGLRETNGTTRRQEERLAFQTRSSRLIVVRRAASKKSAWAVDPSAGKTWRLTPDGVDVAAIAPSPDGDELAYAVAEGPEHWGLWSVRVDGGAPRRILPTQDGIVVGLQWSPRGDLLAYESSAVNGLNVGDPRIWVARADGSQTSLIYGRGEETGSRPVWSPDGRQLSFYENRLGAVTVFNFTRTLVTIPSDGRSPSTWAPDGSAIAFVNRAGPTGAKLTVTVARLGGSSTDAQPITDGQSVDLGPTWSPAGDWIAFLRLAVDGQIGIWVTHPDGKNSRALHQDTNWIYSTPVWSPDGAAVAFGRFHTGSGQGDGETWVAPLAGQPRRLEVTGEPAYWIP
jgi:Tol biopolymer transport system component